MAQSCLALMLNRLFKVHCLSIYSCGKEPNIVLKTYNSSFLTTLEVFLRFNSFNKKRGRGFNIFNEISSSLQDLLFFPHFPQSGSNIFQTVKWTKSFHQTWISLICQSRNTRQSQLTSTINLEVKCFIFKQHPFIYSIHLVVLLIFMNSSKKIRRNINAFLLQRSDCFPNLYKIL